MNTSIISFEVLDIHQHPVRSIRVQASEDRLEIQVQGHNENQSSWFQRILERILPKHIYPSWWKPVGKCMQYTDVVLRLSHHSIIHSERLSHQAKSEPSHNGQATSTQNCKDDETSPSLKRYPGRL